MLSILYLPSTYGGTRQLIEIYNEMLFSEYTQFGHGSGIDPYGKNKYIFPISSGTEDNKAIRNVLYLIGTNKKDNAIYYKTSLMKSSNYGSYSVAIFERKDGANEKYKLISANNKRELNGNFYEAKYIKDENIWHVVNKAVLDEFNQRYGFPLNNTTLSTCNNKPSEVYQVFKKGNDEIYYYSAGCKTWEGTHYRGEDITAIFRKDQKGNFILLWKTLYSDADHWRWEGGSPYITYYIGDLDNDGNIEVFLSKARGLSSTTYLVEIQNNKAHIIYEVKFDSEGEPSSYPTSRNDKLLFMDQVK